MRRHVFDSEPQVGDRDEEGHEEAAVGADHDVLVQREPLAELAEPKPRLLAMAFRASQRHGHEQKGAVERRQELQSQLRGHAHAHEALEAELRGDVADGGGPTYIL